MANKAHINVKWHDRQLVSRTKVSHARHVLLVNDDPSLSRVYGVHGESCLSSLASFDCTWSLPPDIMHDVSEGTVPFVSKHVIKKLVSDGIISLAILNRKLSEFSFQGTDKKSRPPPISHASIFNDSGIKGSAAEKWCLFRFFPFMVGDSVPDSNAAYHVYLSLRSVVDIVCAPQLTTETVPFLESQISEFYESFREVFPDVNCTTKMYYLIHYPRLILLYGSLSKLSCMRFKAKHQYFKLLVRKTHNFINVCRSLSMRHQTNQMYRLAHPHDEMTTVGSKPTTFHDLPELVQERL